MTVKIFRGLATNEAVGAVRTRVLYVESDRTEVWLIIVFMLDYGKCCGRLFFDLNTAECIKKSALFQLATLATNPEYHIVV